MKKTSGSWLILWVPRILGLLFVAFLSLFSLDVFEESRGFWEIALGLFMHNIPSLALLIVIALAWRWPLAGAIVFTLAGVFFMVVLPILLQTPTDEIPYQLIIAGPAILIGALFFVQYQQKRGSR